MYGNLILQHGWISLLPPFPRSNFWPTTESSLNSQQVGRVQVQITWCVQVNRDLGISGSMTGGTALQSLNNRNPVQNPFCVVQPISCGSCWLPLAKDQPGGSGHRHGRTGEVRTKCGKVEVEVCYLKHKTECVSEGRPDMRFIGCRIFSPSSRVWCGASRKRARSLLSGGTRQLSEIPNC